jgi:hypothetical protein
MVISLALRLSCSSASRFIVSFIWEYFLNTAEQTSLGNGEPSRRLRGHRLARVVHFAENEKQLGSHARIWILREAFWRDGAARFEREDVDTGKHGRAHEIGGGEQEHNNRCI